MFRLNPIKGPGVKGDTYDLKYMALFKTRADAEAYQTLPQQTHSTVNGSTAAVDDLGRELPMNDTVGNTKKDRYVGLFTSCGRVSMAPTAPMTTVKSSRPTGQPSPPRPNG